MRSEKGISDRNERDLAKKEYQWAGALRTIRGFVSEERDDHIEERDAVLALEYFLYAGMRTPEHLDWVMQEGEHTPREVIEKVTEGSLGEATYDLLEHNIRADLGSGQPDLVKEDIEKAKRTLGLGIYKLARGREELHRRQFMERLKSAGPSRRSSRRCTSLQSHQIWLCSARINRDAS